jgi:hypothetical protein
MELTMVRTSHCVVSALALAAAACSDNNNFVQPAATAGVRFANDTDTPITISNPGILGATSTTLIYGQSACVVVDLSNNFVPQVTVKNDGTGASITVIPNLNPGDNLTVVAFGGPAPSLQFATLDNHFAPAAGGAGLRFFNGASTDALVMRRNDIVLAPLTGFGEASGFVSVPIDSASITFSTQDSFVLDAGLMAFPQGQNSTVVLGPPASGTVNLRFFTVQGC